MELSLDNLVYIAGKWFIVLENGEMVELDLQFNEEGTC